MTQFSVNQGTQTELLTGSITGGTIVGIMRLDKGTGNSLSDWGGTTTEVGNLVKGTITALAAGTVTAGTLTNLVSGTINALASGTITGGTVQNLATGTINALASGTITGGTLQNLATGTINALATGTITAGTLTNLVSGTINALATGTITAGTLTNLATGTINALATGTITGGTLGNLNYGTVNIDPTPLKIVPLLQGTLGTAGGSFFGTLSAVSGAGTKQYVTGLMVVGQAGTADVRILAGSAIQGTGVLGAGNVVPGGGYARDFTVPFATGTNGELTYHFVGAGSAFITINYWKGP